MTIKISNDTHNDATDTDDESLLDVKAFENALKEISGDDEEHLGFDIGPRRDIGPRTGPI